MMAKKYHVWGTKSKGRVAAYKQTHARILLLSDERKLRAH